MDDRQNLRNEKSRWCVAYPGKTVPYVVTGWYRFKFQALQARRRRKGRWVVLSAETLDAAWAEFNHKEDEWARQQFSVPEPRRDEE